ncbi:hypothetical protein C8R44DRAFT_895559 [Mycena epipterygia]|nr:hypothetical protein C8R44DRAFT_895559 [Mycena epipterygia]
MSSSSCFLVVSIFMRFGVMFFSGLRILALRARLGQDYKEFVWQPSAMQNGDVEWGNEFIARIVLGTISQPTTRASWSQHHRAAQGRPCHR